MARVLAALSLLWLGAFYAGAQPQEPAPSDYANRIAELERRRAETPADASVLEALAGSYAMAERYSDAIGVALQLIELAPAAAAPHLRLARLYAANGELDRALEQVQHVGGDASVEALELKCRILSWKGSAPEAASCYARLSETAGSDSARREEAALGRARNLSWSGQSSAALKAYREYAAAAPKDAQAGIEHARLLRYENRYGEAEEVISAVLRDDPENAQALSLKSEILHWRGHRGREAYRLAEHALRLRPDSLDAQVALIYALQDLGDSNGAKARLRSLGERVRASGFESGASYASGFRYLEKNAPTWNRATLSLPYSVYNDSDGIHMALRGLELKIPAGNHSFSVRAYRHESSSPANSPFGYARGSQIAYSGYVGGTVRLAPSIFAEYSGGAAWPGSADPQPVYSFGLHGSPADRWIVHLGVARDLTPVTPLSIASGTASVGLTAGTEYYFDERTSMSWSAERRFWNDGNKSAGGMAYFQRALIFSRRMTVEAGPRLRIESFARDNRFSSGFFTPDWYDCYEGFVRFRGELGRASYEVRPSIGAQRMSTSSPFRRAWELSGSLNLWLSNALELSGNYQRRNYSLLGTNGFWQGFYFQLAVRP